MRCATLGDRVFLSRDFAYEPHGSGDIRYEIGDGASLRGCVLLARGKGRIVIGEGTVINPDARLESHDSIVVGAFVQIAHGVSIFDTNSHDVRAEVRREVLQDPGREEAVETAGVVIEDDAWIGMHAIVLKGVTVGRGAIVGAGAVVTRSVPAGVTVAGNPARVVRGSSDQGEDR